MHKAGSWVMFLAVATFAGCARNSDNISGPTPSVSSVEPRLLCLEQGERQLTVHGEGLAPLVVDAATGQTRVVLPRVSLIPVATLGGEAVSGSETQLDESLTRWHSDREITVPLGPSLALEPGIYDLGVVNGSGRQAGLARALAITPAPVVESIEPRLACAEQTTRQFTLNGRGFVRVGDELPTVLVGGEAIAAKELAGCEQVPFEALELSLCTGLTFEITAGQLDPGAYTVKVENPAPAGCETSEGVDLLLVPPPSVAAVSPDLMCLAEGPVELTVTGSGFLEIDGALPQVNVGGLALTAGAVEGCTGLLPGVNSCTVVRVTLEQSALAAGAHELNVTNPPPAGCSSTEAVTLAVVDAPAIDDIAPVMFCAAQADTVVTIGGSNFLAVDGNLPRVEAGGKTYSADSVSSCTQVEGTLADASVCEQLVFTLPAGDLPPGAQVLRVLNPAPAACSSGGAESLLLLPEPVVSRASPVVPCDQNASDFTITGENLLKISGVLPDVTIKGQQAQVLSASGCTPQGWAPDVEVCTGLSVSTPAGIGTGEYLVTLLNPGEHSCQAEFTGFVGPPPVVAAVSPLRLCQSGGTITVSGSGFGPGAAVSISGAGRTLVLDTTFIDPGTLEARLPDPTPPGLYDVTVTNSDGCSDTLAAVLDIVPLPIVFFVDPPVTYNGINLQATLYTSGILGTVTRVTINPHGDPGSTADLAFTFVSGRRTQAVLPAGLQPGSYDIQVEDDLGCRGRLDDAFLVVEQLEVALERVELPFGWQNARTGVNVYSPASSPAGMENFQPVPRLYLNPADAAAGTLASELKSVSFVSPERVSATVPAGLPAGVYDLVAVNPDGAVGLLAGAFEVTELPPPEIHELLPASVVNQDVQYITIVGANFRNPAFSADCRQPDGSQVALAGTIEAFTDNSMDVSFDFVTQAIADNSVCIVTVTNDDGTYARYSALAVTNPSLNLDDFVATSTMNVARRAPCAAAGEAELGARFLYAIGGDDGTGKDSTATTYHDTVEFAPIDPYGTLGDWKVLPYRMPEGRSFHGCLSIGRYIYVAGGNGGSGASNTVWRAKILDPRNSPEITDVDILVQDDYSANLTPGRYSYRVSALRPASDPDNPGGETLASDPFMIQVPDIEQRLAITITWSALPGSVGYRIYRTAEPDMPGGSEVLLAEVPGDQLVFTDDGSLTPGTEKPLPLGALGRFQVLPALNFPREGAAFISAADPADPGTNYLYVLGGRDDSGQARADIERLAITVQPDGSQQWDAAWVPGAADIGTARWQLGAWRADQYSAPGIVPAGDSWIYAGGGIDATLQFMEPEVVALKLEAGGALGECAECRYAVDSMQPYKAGYATASCNKQLFAFGATMANAVTESASIEMCPVGGACSAQIPDPPDLANWNNLGIDLTVPRYLMGGVTESAFIFLVGGVDDTPQPLASTEKTLW